MKLNTKDKEKIGIYVIRNLTNEKKYVGKSINIYMRMKQHITLLNTKSKDENPHLINAWHKYGRDAFDYYVIEYLNIDDFETFDCLQEHLKSRETYWMETLETLDREKGYNLRLDSSGGMIPSQETREKLSAALKRRFSKQEERDKISKWAKDFWANNPDKKESMKTKVAYELRKFRYGKFDKETGKLIKIYEVVNDILLDHPDFYLQAIKGCCQGDKSSYKGYKWHYVKLDSDEIVIKKEYKYQGKKKK